MTLLTIIQNVSDEVGLFETPTSVIGNTALDVKKALRFLEVEGNHLVKKHDWSVLMNEQTITTVASQATYDLTSSGVITDTDFDRFVDETEWDRTNFRKMEAINPAEWQLLKSSTTSSAGIERRFRRRGVNLVIDPTPTSADTLVIEYISNKWVRAASGGAKQATYLADGDTTYFDEVLLEAGLKWRLLESYGVKHATAVEEYNEILKQTIGGDSPAETLSKHYSGGVNFVNIQDTDFNL